MTTVARKKGTQTFEATHLWNSLKIRILIWGLQWMNYHFSLNWSRGIRTCNPTWTRSTRHRGRGRRSWSCAWSRWSSILASFSEGTAPRCLKYVGAVRWFPRTPSREFVIVWSKIHHCAFHHSPGTCIAFAEELHAHDSEDEDDDTEDECEVSQSTNGFPHNGDEEVERRPGLGQLEHSQLGRRWWWWWWRWWWWWTLW